MWYKKLLKYLKKKLKKKYLLGGISLTLSLVYGYYFYKKKIPTVNLNYFLLALSENAISHIIAKNGSDLYFKGYGSNKWYYTNASFIPQKQLSKSILKNPNISLKSETIDEYKIYLTTYMILVGGGFLTFLFQNKLFSTKKYGLNRPKVTFKDVYGLENSKVILKEVIDFIKNPKHFKDIGLQMRKGILLYGPSGTGKTLLAKALAGECKINFIYKAASEFVEKYVGVGPKRIRELFEYARNNQPCIIFIDELDAIGSRNNLGGENKNSEYMNTINQLLTEIDGFNEHENIVIIGATNNLNFIDKSLIRSKRFDLKLKIDLPSQKDREGILKLKLKKIKNDVDDEDIKIIGEKTINFTGADIECLVNEAGYLAYREKSNIVYFYHLLWALEENNIKAVN